MKVVCAKVAIDVKHPSIKKEFLYKIPSCYTEKDTIKTGDMVQVPFNQAKVDGVVTEIVQIKEDAVDFMLRNIIKKYPFRLSTEMLQLGKILARYYGTAIIDFLRLMLPPKSGIRYQFFYYVTTCDAAFSNRAYSQKKIYNELVNSGPSTISELASKLNMTKSAVRATITTLVKKGLVKKDRRITYKKPNLPSSVRENKNFKLTVEQEKALQIIQESYLKGKRTILLHGVTGSGKTEVYIRCIEKILKQGKQALLLVPEISLTPQMLSIFRLRFPGKVAEIHSKLSPNERFNEWQRIYNNDAKVVIGARSAVFAPLKNLGIIIIDEEHDSSYKQFDYPYYDARKVAKLRANQNDAVLILGSATPSIESYFQATNNVFGYAKLTKRVLNRPLPDIEVIDMRKELKDGNRLIFSRKLLKGLKQTLSLGHQSILFLNRRGHSTFVLCRDCGFVLKCPYCDISLTYHFKDRLAKCHYCGFQVKAPDICPECRSIKIRYFGAGTQKVEREIKRLFPKISTLRIDSDVTAKKGSLENIMRKFRREEAQILIGTQTVTKGLDFPKVALVGVISADTALNMPDFRAAERTFQQIIQVSGRAGRGNVSGKVYVQTYSPESFAIKAACNNDFENFYNEELQSRYILKYPPFCRLLNIVFTGPYEKQILEESTKIRQEIENQFGNIVDIFGPAPAPRAKIKDNFRYNILLKAKDPNPLIKVQDFLKGHSNRLNKNIKILWDMDPQDLL